MMDMRALIDLVEEASPAIQREVTLKDGTVARLEVVRKSDSVRADVYVGDEYAGGVNFGPQPQDYGHSRPGAWCATDSFVNRDWRRKGISTLCYDAVEELGYRLAPEPRPGKLSPDGEAFWKNRMKSSVTEGRFDTENQYKFGSRKTAEQYRNQFWYHGSDADFDKFALGVRRMGTGDSLWFAENPHMTGYFGPNQYKVKLHFKKPLIVSAEEFETTHKHALRLKAERSGCDAVIIQDITDGDTEGTVCCIFDPRQVEIVDKAIYSDD